jgi:hypothetical protein
LFSFSEDDFHFFELFKRCRQAAALSTIVMMMMAMC